MPNPKLVVTEALPNPPRPLGEAGLSLWNRIQTEYLIVDSGGVEMLTLAAEALDRAAELRAQIDADGLMNQHGRENPLLKHELAARAFVSRTLQRLGLDIETVRAPGCPGGRASGWNGLWQQSGRRC